jgi:hypothetical protein
LSKVSPAKNALISIRQMVARELLHCNQMVDPISGGFKDEQAGHAGGNPILYFARQGTVRCR